jgi:hypothetical protein
MRLMAETQAEMADHLQAAIHDFEYGLGVSTPYYQWSLNARMYSSL